MRDFKFVCTPKNLMLALDVNCRNMLFTLIQYSDFYANEDGWFYASNTVLQTQAQLSKNLVIATIDTLYQAGIVDVQCSGKGIHKTNRIKVNTESFEKYDKYTIEELLNNPELRIETVKYKNNYSPSYIQNGKKIGKKVNTNIDNIEYIDNIENINTIDISIDTEVINKTIKERENSRERESQPSETPKAERQIITRLDNFELSNKELPDMESRLEWQYYYTLKNLPTLEKKKKDFSEGYYLQETLDWEEGQTPYTMTSVMLDWYDGGRAKLAELVQGLPPKVTNDIITYLVLYCKASDTQCNECRLEPVYAI